MKYVPREEIESRISKVKKLMEEASLDGAFFHYKIDYYYLAGTMQDSLLFIPSDDEPILFVLSLRDLGRILVPGRSSTFLRLVCCSFSLQTTLQGSYR